MEFFKAYFEGAFCVEPREISLAELQKNTHAHNQSYEVDGDQDRIAVSSLVNFWRLLKVINETLWE